MPSSCGSGAAGIVCHIIPFIPIVGGEIQAGGKAAQKAVSTVGGDVLSQIAQAMASAANGLLNTLSSFWMNINTPDLTSSGSPVAAIQGDIGWITTGTAVVCILVAAARMAIRRRGQPGAVMAMGLTRLIVVSAAATFVVQAAGKLGDTFSSDLMSAAHLGSGGWSGIISTATLAGAFAAGDGMLLIIALLIIFSSLIQLMLMILRMGLLVILTSTLPLAAAASMSDWGESWWRKHVAWLTAWLLYKPAAALLYAGAFALTHSTSAPEVVSGFMLLILSILILPALLKVVVPMTASLGAASSGTLAMGAAGAVATGAIKIAAMTGTGGAGAAGATGAAAAPSGNAAAAGATKTSGSDGARLASQTDPPPRASSDSSERAVVQPPGTRTTTQDGAGSPATRPADTNGPSGSPSSGSKPADGPTPDEGARPSGSQAPPRSGATGPGGPPGAADHGDDDDEREIGG